MPSILEDLLLAAGSGLLTAAAFAGIGLFPLAWICLLPLLVVLSRRGPALSFLFSWLSGVIFYGVLLCWIPAVPHHYGKLSKGFSLVIYLVLILVLGLFWAFFGAVFGRIRQRYPAWLAFVLAPFVWVSFEYLLTFVLTGFPWGLLGYTQYRNLPLLQSATLAGVFGVSFLIVLFQCLLVLGMNLDARAPAIIGLAIFLSVHAAGLFALKKVGPGPGSFEAGVIQGNVASDIRAADLGLDEAKRRLAFHLNLTWEAIAQGAKFVAWPEYTVPLCFSCADAFDLRAKADLFSLAKTKGVTLLIGTHETMDTANGLAFFNSALCLSPDGSFSQYNKTHLVPFGEYIPYPAVFSFVEGMTSAIGKFTAGGGITLHTYKDVPFATPICYEVIFPELVRRMVKGGAGFLVTITNDGWYGRTFGPYQHFAIAAFRAVENRRFLLRAATTGISGIVDPYGRILVRSKLRTEAVLTRTITPRSKLTFYTQNGDVLPLVGLTLSFIFFILALLTRPHEQRRQRTRRDSARPII
jgi:apolipoprotein N-acyltransferase